MRQIILVAILALCACKKNSEIVPPVTNVADTTFTLAYHLLVSDTTINAITIGGTFSLANGTVFVPPYRIWLKEVFSDTMFWVWSSEVYKGYIAQIRVSVDLVYVTPTKYFFHRNYLLPADTMKGNQDTVIFFRWPEDTLKAVSKWEYYFQ